MKNDTIQTNHRFLDEAGDTTFYSKGKIHIVGQNGVSKTFILGMVKFKEPLLKIRNDVKKLQMEVAQNSYFKVPSVEKRIKEGGFYFHACDDLPEIRKLFYDYIKTVKCSFEAVVGRKITKIYESKHNGKEEEFYADLLSHLLKNKLRKDEKLVLNVAARGKSTRNHNLELALAKATSRHTKKYSKNEIKAEVVFNVQNHRSEPLLNIADYFCWSIQRIFEKGETRFYEFIKDQISLVIDLYDSENYGNFKNYYGPKNPLSGENVIRPLLH